MNNIAIKVSHLTKVYKLYDKPIDRLKESLHPLKKQYHKDFYALNDVNFEIKKGETVGIIGKNGAGKSTLLKIITRVLTPSSGHVHVNGRIASLLELGAGFNPEYTGIENIYLQGTLMGFTHEEMESKIEKVLIFADIGDFVRQPVKMYSSGMFARLAFAVAINVDPDILIVDEALSVGDIKFQQKCLREMEFLKNKGTTILFVSHDLTIIKNLCIKTLFIEKGKMIKYGSTNDVCEIYFNEMYVPNSPKIENKSYHSLDFNYLNDLINCNTVGDGSIIIERAAFVNEYKCSTSIIEPSQIISLEVLFSTSDEIPNFACGLLFKDDKGIGVFGTNTFLNENILKVDKNERYLYTFKFKVPNLSNNKYSIDIAISNGTMLNHTHIQWIHDALVIEVNKKDFAFNNGLYVALPNADIIIEKIERI